MWSLAVVIAAIAAVMLVVKGDKRSVSERQQDYLDAYKDNPDSPSLASADKVPTSTQPSPSSAYADRSFASTASSAASGTHSQFTQPATPSSSLSSDDMDALRQVLAGMENSLAAVESSLQVVKQDMGTLKEYLDKKETVVEPTWASQLSAAAAAAQNEFVTASSVPPATAHDASSLSKEQEQSETLAAFSADEFSVDSVFATEENFPSAGQDASDASAYQAEVQPQSAPFSEMAGHSYRDIISPSAKEEAIPREPSFLEKVWAGICDLKIAQFITASNVWVLAGIAILLVGVVFLVSYAAQFSQITIEMRLGFAACVGLVLLVIGWRQRQSHRELGLILQGGGVAAMYLTIIAGVQLYHIIPHSFAFVLLVAIVAFSTFLAVVQFSKIMAHIAYVAGFLAPVLVSSGSNNFIALFGFYVVLNLGIIAVSRYRDWKSLHLTGLIFTTVIGGVWGDNNYVPENFVYIESFLVTFFLMFSYLAIAGGSVQSFTLKDKKSAAIDIPLTFGTPLIFILFQSALVEDMPFVLAFTALFMGAGYLMVTLRLRSKWQQAQATMATPPFADATLVADDAALDKSNQIDSAHADATQQQQQDLIAGWYLKGQIFLALGVVFSNLALPLALYDLGLEAWRERLLAIIWATEGASLVWIGWRQHLKVCRWLGLAAYGLSVFFFASYLISVADKHYYVLTAENQYVFEYGRFFVSMVLLGIGVFAFMVGAYVAWVACHKRIDSVFAVTAVDDSDAASTENASLPESAEEREAAFWHIKLAVAGLGLFVLGCIFEVSLYHNWMQYMEHLFYCFFVGSLVTRLAETKWQLPTLRWFAVLPLAPFAIITAICTMKLFVIFAHWNSNPLPFLDLVTTSQWSLAGMVLFAMHEMYCRYKSKRNNVIALGCELLAVFGLIALSTVVFIWLVRGNDLTDMFVWWRMVLFVCPAIALFVFQQWITPQAVGNGCWMRWSTVAAGWMTLWLVTDFFALGDPAPLPFIPLLNPLELGIAWSLFALVLWSRRIAEFTPVTGIIRSLTRLDVLMALLFCLINFSIVRACALNTDMAYSFSGALQSSTCQAFMAIIWALFGGMAMFLGNRMRFKSLWLLGAALMLADVLKLFFLDLTRLETVWRIVAFMLVGLTLILIGYLFPLPPTQKEETSDAAPELSEGATVDAE